MPATIAADHIFFLLADARLGPLFAPPAIIDTDLCQYMHLPLLSVLLTALRSSDAVFIDSSPSVTTYAEQIVTARDLGTRIRKLTTGQRNSLSPTCGPIGFVHCDLTSTRPRDWLATLDNLGPKLAPDVIFALHGTETEAGGGVWNTLTASSPHYLFPHGAGLGLIAPGHVPDPLAPLMGTDMEKLDPTAQARLHTRFSFFGTHWSNNARIQVDHIRREEQKTAERQARLVLSETRFALAAQKEEADARLTAEQSLISHESLRAARAEQQHQSAVAARDTAQQQLAEVRSYISAIKNWTGQFTEHINTKNAEIARLKTKLAGHEEGLDALRHLLETRPSLPRRLARAVRRQHFVPSVPKTPGAPEMLHLPPPPEPPALCVNNDIQAPDALPLPVTTEAISWPPHPLTTPDSAILRNVLFVSGEPTTPGSLYRCTRNAAACTAAGHNTRVRPCGIISPEDVFWADIIILWRVEFSGHVATIIRLTREKGGIVIFDVDDLVFLPMLASISIIDGIRTAGGNTEAGIHNTFTKMQATLDRADASFGTTAELTTHLRRLSPVAFTLPNIFDAATLRRSRLAARIRKAEGTHGLIRIGYASGTRTHQRDFAVVADVLAELMQTYTSLRLVLFRESDNQRSVLLMEEFPSLAPFADQIEWRDLVPLDALPDEYARFDINIAPLEVGNPFCEAKSEIKFFEPALTSVPSVVSPTSPFRACIINGVTGFLAETQDEWRTALTRLIESPDLRTRIARNAASHVLWNFGPERQAMLFDAIIMSFGNEAATARATETILARGGFLARNVPEVPDSTVLFEHDALLASADVTVVITSHNYAGLIVEALESVRAQTMKTLDLVVVDDASTDDSPDIIVDWARQHTDRFNRLLVLAPKRNTGLGGARNIAVSASETPYYLSLDADNRLLPNACEALLSACDSLTAYAYPLIRTFDGKSAPGLMGDFPFRPLRLQNANMIDAMAFVAKWAWSAVGGYYVKRDAMGWEDYDLWCSFTEMGLKGTHLPEIVAEYRIHENSMTNNVTEELAHKARVVDFILSRHSWLDIHREARKRD
ncbi:glycosyltransferase [Acetobacter fallax]|uniref:Glycosyltransferase n=1 Tax=Acetobacter fallax TaxID=1737473 RepID=A0ABX0K9W5_9PROT|nr:glycosyltransferase [Acetobacter fallax]NHO31618.1 glycosyltransferase [Acetobacter fallax]NHO35177.1 glycosyltransferase [Acetobacter fallax]